MGKLEFLIHWKDKDKSVAGWIKDRKIIKTWNIIRNSTKITQGNKSTTHYTKTQTIWPGAYMKQQIPNNCLYQHFTRRSFFPHWDWVL
jgi:hypothetical protein